MPVALAELFRSRAVAPAELQPVGRFTRVRYALADRVIDVAIAIDPFNGTTVGTPCRALDGFLLRLRHDDRGTSTLGVGDATFQATYSIETSDAGVAIALLDAPTRQLIAFTGHVAMPTRRRDRCYSYTVAQGFVSAHASAAEESAEALEDVILAIDAVARRPEALTAAWRRIATELDAEVRGAEWTVAGGLVIVIASPTGAFTVTVGEHAGAGAFGSLATQVIDDAQTVVWIDSLAPDSGRIRAAIAQLSARGVREPYR